MHIVGSDSNGIVWTIGQPGSAPFASDESESQIKERYNTEHYSCDYVPVSIRTLSYLLSPANTPQNFHDLDFIRKFSDDNL